MDMSGSFDLAAFRDAFQSKDVARWLGFFVPDATWVEYRHGHPPSHPNLMKGHGEIAAFLHSVASADPELHITHEVVNLNRAAFRVTCVLPDGRTVLEHVILELQNGLIVEQVDIEVWDGD